MSNLLLRKSVLAQLYQNKKGEDDPYIPEERLAVRLTSPNQALSRTGGLDRANNWTQAAWIYHVTATGTFRNIFDMTGSSQELLIELNNTTWRVFSNAGVQSSGINASAATWYYVCWRKTGVDVSLWVGDGVSGSVLTTLTMSSNRSSFTTNYIGAWGGAGDWANMRVAYERSWTSVLTNDEVVAEMTSIQAVKTSTLFSDCPLQGHTDLSDVSGGGHGWSVIGSPTTEAGPVL